MAATNESDIATNGSNGEYKVIPLEPVDQWTPIDKIRTFVFLVVHEILDGEAMRAALDRLIRNHLPILGARLDVSKNKDLAYRLPKTFPLDYRLFQWSTRTVESSLAKAQLLPDVSQGDCDILHGPCSIPELEGVWTPSTWPTEWKFEGPDMPFLLVHVTKFADATVVALNIPHSVTDQMGVGSLITAWMQVVKGETPAEFLQLEPGALDGLKNPSEELLRKKNDFRVMRKSERFKALLNHVPELILYPKETLKAKYGEETPPLTSGDIITAILVKLAFLGRKSSRIVAISSAVNCRGRHPALPADKPYLHNAGIYSVFHMPNPDQVPLAELAYKHRLAVIEALRLENIERSLAARKEIFKPRQSHHIVEADQLSYSCTNWCGAWRNIDFAPAVVSKEDADGCVTAAPLVLGHSLQRSFPTRYNAQIMCKANGGFWCDFTTSTKRYPLVEKLLKADPQLVNF
ncbi:BCL5p [Penicillium cinerascens]|uniref:BCL5p n=1 Tax=Penicillium cinerascens TaxID=70096 RepID=A0A9W9T7P4_9EURO|nr:BCL5p [Penicillium cinerascens]KAJ5212374.1 BCL5p [Penicillium cinerascens]